MPSDTPRIAGWKTLATLGAAWAVLFALTFPPVNAWPLAYLSLVPLTLLALAAPRARAAAGWAYLSTFAWCLAMIPWMAGFGTATYIAMSLYLPIYPVLYVLALRCVHKKGAKPLFPFALTVPVLWVATEYLRGGMHELGLPYFLLGQSQPTLVIQSADLFGAYGVSFLVAMINGWACDVILRDRGMRDRTSNIELPTSNIEVGGRVFPWGLRRWTFDVRCSMFAPPLLFTAALLYGLFRTSQPPDASAPTFRIAVVQTHVTTSHRSGASAEQKAANFAAVLALTEQALAQSPDLVVLPETAIPTALDDRSAAEFPTSRAYREPIENLVATHRVPLLVGALSVPWDITERPAGAWFNSAFLFQVGGGTQRYDKVVRAPFGEYLPWIDDWEWAWKNLRGKNPTGREYYILKGEGFKVFELSPPSEGGAGGGEAQNGGATHLDAPPSPSPSLRGRGTPIRFATPICFEDVFPSVCRAMVWEGGTKRVDFLVSISNDGWFAGTTQAHHHEQMSRFRCVENRVPMARAVNTGVSGFIDSTGRVLARVEVDGQTQSVAGVKAMTLRGESRTTVYAKVGEVLPIGCVVSALLLIAISTAWKRGASPHQPPPPLGESS